MSEELVTLLGPISSLPQIGPETERRDLGDIKIYESVLMNSYRYVRFIGKEPVCALQIVTRDGKTGHAAQAYTKPEHRRKGFATELLEMARQWDFETVLPSTQLSEDGAAWTKANWKETQ